MGGLAALIFLIFIVARALDGGGEVTFRRGSVGDTTGRRSLYISIAAIGTAVCVGFAVRNLIPEFLIAFCILTGVVAGSGIIAGIFARFGHFRLAYFAGRINVFNFARNPHALDLYRGYCAVSRLPSVEKKQEALRWLLARVHKSSGKIYTGEMIMYVIIDAQLMKPGDLAYLAKRLLMLNDFPTASIPRHVSILACKLAIIPALSRGDWQGIVTVAKQWDTPAPNYIARYLNEFHGRHFSGDLLYSSFNCWRYGLLLWRHRDIVRFAKKSLKAYNKSREENGVEAPKQRLLTSSQGRLNEKNRKDIQVALTNKAAEREWQSRAKQLGLLDLDRAWQALSRSVDLCPKLRLATENIEDEAVFQNIEQYHRSLYYIKASIAKKLDKKMKGPALPHFLDWLQVLHVLGELQEYKREQVLAFSRIDDVIWNWVADLWNIRKERCLAHYIATVCRPLARDSGNTELQQIFSGIVNGNFR